jgi:hypothetical protein
VELLVPWPAPTTAQTAPNGHTDQPLSATSAPGAATRAAGHDHDEQHGQLPNRQFAHMCLYYRDRRMAPRPKAPRKARRALPAGKVGKKKEQKARGQARWAVRGWWPRTFFAMRVAAERDMKSGG